MGCEREHAAFHPAKAEMVAKLRDDRVQPAVGAHVDSMRRCGGLVHSRFRTSDSFKRETPVQRSDAESAEISAEKTKNDANRATRKRSGSGIRGTPRWSSFPRTGGRRGRVRATGIGR